jgi:hypothetical protein
MLAIVALSVCCMLPSCAQNNIRECRLKYTGWAIGGGWYPPRPDGPGRLEIPWMYEVAFAGSQDETGGRYASEFKLLRLVIVRPGGEHLDLTDCIVIEAKDVGVETTWHTEDGTLSMNSVPYAVDFKFINNETGEEIKTVSYPLPK